MARCGYARVGRIARSATFAARHAPACPSRDRGERSSVVAKRSQRATHARTPRPRHPSFIAGLLAVRSRASSRGYCCFRTAGMPTHDGTNMPKLSGAERVRTRRRGALSPLACWLPCHGPEPLKDGLADRSPSPLRPFAVRPSRGPVRVGESPCRSGPAVANRGAAGGLGDAHELARRLVVVLCPRAGGVAHARL